MLIKQCRCLGRLQLGPRRYPKHQHFFQRPHVVRQPRRHRRGPRLPHLGRAFAMRRNGLGQTANASWRGARQNCDTPGTGSGAGATRLHPYRGGAAPPNRGYALAHGQVKPVTVGRRITPPTAVPERSVPFRLHSAPQYPDACHAYLAGDSPLLPRFRIVAVSMERLQVRKARIAVVAIDMVHLDPVVMLEEQSTMSDSDRVAL